MVAGRAAQGGPASAILGVLPGIYQLRVLAAGDSTLQADGAAECSGAVQRDHLELHIHADGLRGFRRHRHRALAAGQVLPVLAVGAVGIGAALLAEHLTDAALGVVVFRGLVSFRRFCGFGCLSCLGHFRRFGGLRCSGGLRRSGCLSCSGCSGCSGCLGCFRRLGCLGGLGGLRDLGFLPRLRGLRRFRLAIRLRRFRRGRGCFLLHRSGFRTGGLRKDTHGAHTSQHANRQQHSNPSFHVYSPLFNLQNTFL